jgi:hypothetical protein
VQEAPRFFAELGLPVSAAQAPQLAPALAVVTAGAGELISTSLSLDVSIDSKQNTLVLKGVFTAGSRISSIISGFEQLKAALAAWAAGVRACPRHVRPAAAQPIGDQHWPEPQVADLLEFPIVVRTDFNVGLVDPSKPFYTSTSCI